MKAFCPFTKDACSPACELSVNCTSEPFHCSIRIIAEKIIESQELKKD